MFSHKRISLLMAAIIFAAVLVGSIPTAASEAAQNGITDGERARLFAASQAMAAARNTPPKWRAGMVVSEMGPSEQVSTGARLEYTIDDTHYFRTVLEAVYLETDDGAEIATLASVKAVAVDTRFGAPYLGAGVGITGPYRYQAFVGTEFRNGFFAEIKYMNESWELQNGNMFYAVGFLLRF